jgi:FAD:protein FMN transferase
LDLPSHFLGRILKTMFRSSLMVASLLLCLAACVSRTRPEASELQRYEFEEPQMGVPFRIVLYATNETHAQRAADAAFARIADLNTIMSDYETDSELSKLSRSSEQGSPEVQLSDDLWRVLEPAQRLAAESDGAFDITIGPCVGLWRKARRERELPDASRLENARRKIGYQNLILNQQNRSARLLRFGMRLDLGAIAKGYAADQALETLKNFGIDRALVAASGDLSLGKPPPGDKGWRVEIVGYDARDGPPSAIVPLANCGIATSGDLFQRVEINGVRYSHIVNPFTCVGMTNHALATVVAKNCMSADSLATVMTIVEPNEALAIATKRNAAARIVTMKDGKPVVEANTGFRRIVSK